MPCYTPPPKWSNAQEANAQKAVPLLCAISSAALHAGMPILRDQLVWYIEHLQLDINVETHDYMGYNLLPPEKINQPRLAELRELLEMAKQRLATFSSGG